MASDFEIGSFTLSSFEDPLAMSAPGNHLARCYFVVLEKQGRCDQLLCDVSGCLLILPVDQLPLSETITRPITEQYLGHDQQQQYWVAVFPETTFIGDYQWLGLRSQLGNIDQQRFNLAGRALQIAQWFFDHAYCGRCGNATRMDDVDRARVCPQCQLRFYPRISPCMIVLVTRGDHILLAHHKRSSRPVYTTLAGFVEAGERVEDTVQREVMEEVGIKLGTMKYFGSQSWSFPGQLMLGFIAEYESGEIVIDHQEIVAAEWFRYDHLPHIPPKATVAGELIDSYVQECIKKYKQ